MAWVRLDDQFPDHPKVAGLSNDAFCLHVTAMCYAAKQQTDGKLPSRLLSRLAWRCQDPAIAAAELVEAGVWDTDPVDGWQIHDYGEYNPTKAQSSDLASKRSEAGKAGAMARWQNHSKPDGKPHSKPHGKTMPPSPNDDDREWQQALADMQVLGLWSKADRDRFVDMWPELSGRQDWVGKAITIARDKGARAGIPYALKVLANALHTGKEPGYVNGESKDAPKPRQSYDNPEALERSRRIEEAARELAAQGITQETDNLWLVKLDDLVEAKYGYRP